MIPGKALDKLARLVQNNLTSPGSRVIPNRPESRAAYQWPRFCGSCFFRRFQLFRAIGLGFVRPICKAIVPKSFEELPITHCEAAANFFEAIGVAANSGAEVRLAFEDAQ